MPPIQRARSGSTQGCSDGSSPPGVLRGSTGSSAPAPTGPGSTAAWSRAAGLLPTKVWGVNAFVCTSAVSNVDETVAAAQRLGANVAVPKMAIPTVGWLALKDTEGNLLGVMANDPAAR